MPHRSWHTLAVVFSVVLCAACSKQSSKSPLQIEADSKAQEWWNSTVARCGDDYFIISKWNLWLTYPEAAMFVHEDLYQFKSPGFVVTERPLTSADQLNGYQWRGNIVVPVTAHRSYELSSYDPHYKTTRPGTGGWSSWDNGAPKRPPDLVSNLTGEPPEPMIGTSFYKQNGKWTYGLHDMQARPKCDALPK